VPKEKPREQNKKVLPARLMAGKLHYKDAPAALLAAEP